MKKFIKEINMFMYPNQESFSKTETFFALLGVFVILSLAWLPMTLLVYTW